ncbi:fumarylacetoacetate hydrolase family protein [Sphingomonas bacterium]|uniref:fumarylacetoacetate hydrolase family protein n=1 Tax=Sphingomonas bacterium TaxID=1895847 RepID=UPI0015773D1F|nr:fumarylacetoacetate hydrolase family protein [Sphingomonas bacterium]
MKIAGYLEGDRIMVGAVAADGAVTPLGERDAFWVRPSAAVPQGAAIGMLADLRERPAIPTGARVICVGLNYRLHAQETGSPIPTVPVIFSRWTRSLTTDGQPVPKIEDKFDWEVEIGAVIGRRVFRVTADQAVAGIFGYVAFNDLSGRSFQRQTPQWTMGKNSDASGPMSPVVTADEVGDPAAGLRLTTHVNGELRQDSTTADMIFSVPEIIAHVSQVMTLEPGDLIITGTPAGVGLATGTFLDAGDEVVIEVERIGRVRTPIVPPPAPIF